MFLKFWRVGRRLKNSVIPVPTLSKKFIQSLKEGMNKGYVEEEIIQEIFPWERISTILETFQIGFDISRYTLEDHYMFISKLEHSLKNNNKHTCENEWKTDTHIDRQQTINN